ncbi:DUF4760 domain-containing protein [Actinomycetospora atypica]|uniref:Uncharacterized protein n=1 Tax=Actinomycetospora atypica TaxID=1290095 RepID=A0ABV9YGL8_9PSEU
MTIATTVSIVSVLVTLSLAVWGFRRTSNADQLRAFSVVHDRYLEERVRIGRRAIHQHVASGGKATLSDEMRSNMTYALAVMNSVAVSCDTGFVDQKLIARTMGRSFVSAVDGARWFIDESEQVRGYRPYGYAEQLADQLRRRVDLGGSKPPQDGVEDRRAEDRNSGRNDEA